VHFLARIDDTLAWLSAVEEGYLSSNCGTSVGVPQLKLKLLQRYWGLYAEAQQVEYLLPLSLMVCHHWYHYVGAYRRMPATVFYSARQQQYPDWVYLDENVLNSSMHYEMMVVSVTNRT
jgi:hypothetical protein